MKLFMAITLLAFLATGSLGVELSKNDLERFCSTVNSFLADGTQPNEVAALVSEQFLGSGLLQRIPGEKGKGEKTGEKDASPKSYGDYYKPPTYYPPSHDNYYPQFSNYYSSNSGSYSSNSYDSSNTGSVYYPYTSYYPTNSDSYSSNSYDPSNTGSVYYPYTSYYPTNNYGSEANYYDSYYYPSKDEYNGYQQQYPNSYYGYPYNKAKPQGGDDKQAQRQGVAPVALTLQQGGKPQGAPQGVAQVAPQGPQQGAPQGPPRNHQGAGPSKEPQAHPMIANRFFNGDSATKFVDQLVGAFVGAATQGQIDCSKFTFPESIDLNNEEAFGELQNAIKSTA